MATINGGKTTLALGALDTDAVLQCYEIGRPETGPNDVSVDIKYCGMCHSDCHACNGDWYKKYPLAPGHEAAGIVRAVGSNVSNFKVGDKVGVGFMVESCRTCNMCQEGLEQHCKKSTQTYGYPFPEGKGDNFAKAVGSHTNGGYSSDITVNEHFVFHVPDGMDIKYAGVLLCAGVTTFSPLNRHILKNGGGKGKTVAIVGFGGLGQMGIKIAQAMGVDSVTILSRNEKKRADAERLGCKYVIYTDKDDLAKAADSFTVVLDTVSASHDIASLARTLRVGGHYVLLGAVLTPFPISAAGLLSNRHSIEGSLVGGIPETQETLDFCAEHNIVPEYEVIAAKDANDHFKSLLAGTSGAHRAVIDMETLKDLPVVDAYKA